MIPGRLKPARRRGEVLCGDAAGTLKQPGVQLRQADYDDPQSLERALEGVDRLLLISAVVSGQRLRQHKAVIDAAKSAGTSFVAYTSMLNGDTSTHILVPEHLATEQYLSNSGLQYALLRNAWNLENHTGTIDAALQHGALVGSAGKGRFASATRADLAQATVAVLNGEKSANRTYELAGDTSFSMQELAKELSNISGKTIAYNYMERAA